MHPVTGWGLLTSNLICTRKIGPFDCCSVVQGDCLELMKQLPIMCECGEEISGEGGLFHFVGGHKEIAIIDAIITDPPYGINANVMTLGTGKKDFARGNAWDASKANLTPLMAVSRYQAIWGGNYYTDILPPTNNWLIWHKLNDGLSFSECEMAWTNYSKQVRHLQHHWGGEEKVHPTMKPLAVMEWVINQLPDDAQTVFDPFAGSGTTLVAAKKLGRHFLGFEISAEYCQIARERLARIDAQPKLFETHPEQLALA